MPHERFHDEAQLLAEVARLLAARQDRRLVSRADGVWPAGSGGAQHHRRPAQCRDAGHDESQDQVPRELPALCAVRAAGTRERIISICRRDQESPYMLLVAPVLRETARELCPRRRRKKMTADADLRQAGEHRALHLAGDHPRGLQRAHADRGCRAARAVLSADEGVRAGDRLPGPREHQLQRPRRTDRCIARTTPTAVFCATDMDALVLEDFLLRKEDLKDAPSDAEKQKHLSAFAPD